MDKASSNSISLVLLFFITILLAVSFYPFAYSTLDQLASSGPLMGASSEYIEDGENNDGNRPYFILRYVGRDEVNGTDILIRDEKGNTISWFDVWTAEKPLEPGDRIHIDGYQSDGKLSAPCSEDKYTIIHKPTNKVIHLVEIKSSAVGKASTYC